MSPCRRAGLIQKTGPIWQVGLPHKNRSDLGGRKKRSDLESGAAPEKQVRSRRSKKEVRSGKWGCPRKTGPGLKVRCGRWDYQNGPSFPSMSNMGGTSPRSDLPNVYPTGPLPKWTSFSGGDSQNGPLFPACPIWHVSTGHSIPPDCTWPGDP